jgi:Glyoxalase/Bleomycin resistance protein/Dioxygenase superfamily
MDSNRPGVTSFVHVGLVVEDLDEVVRFQSPCAGAQEPAPAANRPGLRHIAFKVDDVRGVVDRVREAGWETVGEIVDFENTFLLCYVRGPEGLIVELAERLDGAPGRTPRLNRLGFEGGGGSWLGAADRISEPVGAPSAITERRCGEPPILWAQTQRQQSLRTRRCFLCI